MTDRRTGRRLLAALQPILLVVGCAALAGWLLRPDDEPQRQPVDIAAQGQRFDDLNTLAGASQLIIEGFVIEVEDGRAITDPADPTTGIRTQLASIQVMRTIVNRDAGSDSGSDPGPLIVEQESQLLDGTPVQVNGVAPLAVGDSGLMFLIRGTSDDFPYTAFVNEQGWVPVVDDRISPLDRADPVWADDTDRATTDVIDDIASVEN